MGRSATLAARPARAMVACLAIGAAAAQSSPPAAPPASPRTTPERTAHAETSRLAEVEAFLADCKRLPQGGRLTLDAAGTSHEGRPLRLVKVRRDGAPKPLRALVIGSIHAGEIEGKEALQQLAREFALGDHDDVLQHVELWLLPIYNVDGNEAVQVGNRPGQNGPDATGQRPNAQGLDLNRDFVKADAPETRALLQTMAAFDPHLFVDLHTTNGSYHGYHLTYAPSLSPNVDPAIARLSRALLDDAQAAMRRDHGFATFDYGNFETRDRDGSGAPSSDPKVRGWWTYDHRARYCVNGFALRNRVAVLSEAYSNLDFAGRIAATRAFVLCLLQGLVAREAELLATTQAADARLIAGERAEFGFDTAFAPPERLPVLVGAVDTVDAKDGRPLRHVRKGDGVAEEMPVVRAFAARQRRELPRAWALPAPPAAVVERLRLHGVACRVLEQAEEATCEQFVVAQKKKPKRPYQGHQELVLVGAWEAPTTRALPKGTLWIDARQRFARVAATLLEPESEDGLSTWNFLEEATGERFPVVRVR
ncbi:MAG: M14 family zinc carboxypeptidase [Planctomycetota bacterium]